MPLLKIPRRVQKYGRKNWRLGWLWQGRIIGFSELVSLVEEAYWQHFQKHPEILHYLINNARDVYDFNEKDIESGLDYSAQMFDIDEYRLRAKHLQDIAIRRIIRLRLGLKFQGNKLIQIRSTSKYNTGRKLSPGFVPFHLPHTISRAFFKGWWQDGTIEAFYQQNMVIQIRNKEHLVTIAPAVFTHSARGVIKKILFLKSIGSSA
jgi:hypothetical protein